MIPKIIHYCWFGRKPKPQEVLDFIANWKAICPDYTIKEWNEDNFDVNMMPFTKEAYKVKKYAFVADVCRLYALLNEGGVYLDTDVRLKKSFDQFLGLKSFIGKEAPFTVGTAVIGAERGCLWVQKFYDTYKNKHFITRRGLLNSLENTAILTRLLNCVYPNYLDELKVYGIDYFCGKLYSSKQYVISPNTVAIHEFSGSWVKKEFGLISRLLNIYYRLSLQFFG